MNNLHPEFMAEYRRQEILMEAEQIRMEKIALQARPYRPRVFARTMFNFGNWMITAGNQLRKRYEIPTVQCSKTATGSFAR